MQLEIGTDNIVDVHFNKGMLEGAKALGDPVEPGGNKPGGTFTPKWDKNWIPGATVKDATGKDVVVKEIHGLIMVTGDNQQRVDDQLDKVRKNFGSISQVHKLEGNIRPGDQKGHEQSVKPSIAQGAFH